MTDPLGTTENETRLLITTYSKYNNNKQNMVIFYKKWKKYNEIQSTKNKVDLNIRKMTNHHPPQYEIKKKRPNYCSSLLSPWGHYGPKQWMNYLTNQTFTYNPLTAPGKEQVHRTMKFSNSDVRNKLSQNINK